MGGAPLVSSWLEGMEPLLRHMLRVSRAFRRARDAVSAWRLLHPRCMPQCGPYCLRSLNASLWVDHVEQELFLAIQLQSFDGTMPFTTEGWAANERALTRHLDATIDAQLKLTEWLNSIAGNTFGSVNDKVDEDVFAPEEFYTCNGGGPFEDLCNMHLSLRPPLHVYDRLNSHDWAVGGTRWTRDDPMLFRMATALLREGDHIADVGAGPGFYSEWLNGTGIFSAIPFDGSPEIERMTRGRVRRLDVTKPLVQRLRGKFNWVLSLEFIEHVPPNYERVILENLAALCTVGAVISWSPDHQTNHVNAQPFAYVIKALQRVGLELDQAATEDLRKASKVSYISRSLGVYRKST